MKANLKLLRYIDLQRMNYGSRTTIWRKIKDSNFPKPRSQDGKPVWRESDILDYFNSLPEHSGVMPKHLQEVRS